MYYEARTHEIVEVTNAVEAAIKIKSGKIYTYQVMKWISRNGKFFMYAVPDGHLDNMLLELAILRQEINQNEPRYQQIESITNGWIDDAYTLGKYLEESESSDFIMSTNAQLIIGRPKGHEMAWFTCGCCGNSFLGNVQEQIEFDQDAGYGICDSCQKW
ncbi:hypothetical protein LWM68_15115 [Niabella sp. W65]|nr:hypothetical protein [Niabella sp. W65]MCH7363972.1 hypothetical protein [Niabella sp. W65]ULT39860.1 hypothetical protein KRR40_33915 [Niabella sp. I65]